MRLRGDSWRRILKSICGFYLVWYFGFVGGNVLFVTLFTTDFKFVRSSFTTPLVDTGSVAGILTVDSCRNACDNAVSGVVVGNGPCRSQTTACGVRNNHLGYSFPRVNDVPNAVAVSLTIRMSRRANRVATCGKSRTNALSLPLKVGIGLCLSSLESTGVASGNNSGRVRFALSISNAFLKTGFPTSIRFMNAG